MNRSLAASEPQARVCPWELTFDIVKTRFGKPFTQVDQGPLGLAPGEAAGVGGPDPLGCHPAPSAWEPLRCHLSSSVSPATSEAPTQTTMLPAAPGATRFLLKGEKNVP